MAATYTQRTYTESAAVEAARRALQAHAAAQPGGYTSRWQPDLDALVEQILNREDFQYDLGADPLFQQYQDRYVNLGQRAMMDTLGQAAALTGGYGNSYAQLAGQQAYGTHLQGLYDQLPELYQLALDRYDRQEQQLSDRYGLLQGLESGDYTRYQDALAAWGEERGYLTDRFDSERDFDYGAYRDAVGDDQWRAEYDETQRQFNFKNKLGEFAPTYSSGSGSGSGSSQRSSAKTQTIDPKMLKQRHYGLRKQSD